jgi:hypothetical protein
MARSSGCTASIQPQPWAWAKSWLFAVEFAVGRRLPDDGGGGRHQRIVARIAGGELAAHPVRCRHILRHRDELHLRTHGAGQGADAHVPPFRRAAQGRAGRAEAGAAVAAGLRQRGVEDGVGFLWPQCAPRAALHLGGIGDLHGGAAAPVGGHDAAFAVQQVHAVGTVFEQVLAEHGRAVGRKVVLNLGHG